MFAYNTCKYLLKSWVVCKPIGVNLKLPQYSSPGSLSIYLCAISRVSLYKKHAGGVPVCSCWSVGFFHSHSGLEPFSLLPRSLRICMLKVVVQEHAI